MSIHLVDAALVQHLAADTTVSTLATGGVWFGTAPPEATFPHVVANRRLSGDDGVLSGDSTVVAEYLVKAVDKSTSVLTVGQLEEACRRRVEDDPFTAAGTNVMAAYRIQTVGPYQEFDGETVYQHRPGVYEVMFEPA